MITAQRLIREQIPRKITPIRIAALCYKQWGSKVEFIDDLDDYLLNGVVIARPDIFGMAKITDLAPEGAKEKDLAWFIRMAVGDLPRLLEALPCYLPKISFCRRNDGRVRVYRLERLLKLTKGKEWAAAE